jgi:hypothetical protein
LQWIADWMTLDDPPTAGSELICRSSSGITNKPTCNTPAAVVLAFVVLRYFIASSLISKVSEPLTGQ